MTAPVAPMEARTVRPWEMRLAEAQAEIERDPGKRTLLEYSGLKAKALAAEIADWRALASAQAAPVAQPAQQAGDVALSEQAVCDMVREHGLLTDKGVRLASNGDFVSLNLTAITAIVNCAIAQGRKA